MPKVEFDFDELERTACEAFCLALPVAVERVWRDVEPWEREAWREAGIAVVKLFAGRVQAKLDEMSAEEEADTADAPSEPPAGLRKAQYESDEDPF